ncbi:TrgA family protein [Sedimentitalea todarodis]|uniref:TrgA family protein n=1 Tax=Sedimentitalea todarodis TaxID=1631240 RepID=A0ABU3VCF8_9RHOB|nr:TrgA family protein [Sedimentitalea todarodis]MDU9003834.1 TrgA family protein [Sedimentitalea todarodis]
MPTTSRLVAAVCLALLAYVLSRVVMPLMPEGMNFGYFIYVNMGLGVLIGWNVIGSRAGRGTTAAINNGLTGVVALIFWGLFVQGCYEMFDQAMNNRFDGPFEALVAILEIAAEYALILLTPTFILTALLGGALSGLATECAWRRWR